ncbi:uncharacterized protein LOC131628465 [Vicia villosa]|uniref:uncharacterized protein LOC131628465 n=1 Tax=Vicia villosa TaxID=3911 RepID=UPI00273BC5AB|nr:uncharacterized protein LOC131628465 [Vicia villosa]
MWTLDEDCDRLIREAWTENFHGCHMFILDQKLKNLKNKLKVWNKNKFGNVQNKTILAGGNLKAVQKEVEDYGYNDILHEKEIKAQNDLDIALNMEEELWKEKSRLNWQLHGDRNTKYFHTYAKIKRKTKLITSLLIEGKIETDQVKLDRHIENHFTNLFKSNFQRQDIGLIRRVIFKLVNDQTNTMLIRIPNASEIHDAILNLNIDSAPGPDGFGAIFYGWISPNYNANIVVLIPKTKEANNIDLFRPIAMENFKFKVITKILADMLASILPSIISPEQKDFITGRSIKDGICLTFEAINFGQQEL